MRGGGPPRSQDGRRAKGGLDADLVGRDDERRAIEQMLAGVDEGGSAVVIRGEPGIGKTSLLDHAAAVASSLGSLSSHRLRGIESEAVLPFAALGDLLLPLRRHFDELPPVQRTSLEASLSLQNGSAGSPANPYAVCVAALNVLAAASERHPRLILVDDLHWIDPSSRRVLLFVARRLSSERIGIVITIREDATTDSVFGDLAVIDLLGLSDRECEEVLDRRELRVHPSVQMELCRISRGNPLVLIEVAQALDESQRRGAARLPDLLEVGQTLDRAWLTRLGSLPASTRDALVVLAASRSPALRKIATPLRTVGSSTIALGAAEQAGLIVRRHDGYEFRHPVLRHLILARSPLETRGLAYSALADASSGAVAAWYRAAAATAPSPQIADELAIAATEARTRCAYEAASFAWQRAATLSATPPTAASYLRSAAEDAFLGGDIRRAAALCEEALDRAPDARMRADIELVRGRVLTWIGSPGRAHDLLVNAGRFVRDADPALSAQLFMEATFPAVLSSRFTEAERNAQEGARLARIAGTAPTHGELMMAEVALIRGRVAEACQWFDRVSDVLASKDPVVDAPELSVAGHCLGAADRPRAGRELLNRVIDAGRRVSAPAALPYALAARAELDAWEGRMSSAYADATEALGWADELDERSALGYALVTLGRLDAIRGDLDLCAQRLARTDVEINQVELRAIACFAPALAGFAALSRGDHESAVEHLMLAHDEIVRIGLINPSVLPYAADLIEAHIRSGDRNTAKSVLEHFERCTDLGDLAWARAAVARCHGLLASSLSECRDHFGTAAAAHRRRTMPFEQARTRLCEGEMLRRFRQPRMARPPLRLALATFRSLGARLWAARAESELAAAGGRQEAGRTPVAPLALLTPQELQVAQAAARGLNNPEVAASLFVSRKTVEAHLTRVYRKLGVRSRTDLTRLIVSTDAGMSI